MLVLRRRAGEALLIGGEIEIELLAVSAHSAKIGIRAPKDTVVLRKELKVTQEQNVRAAKGPVPAEMARALEKLRLRTQEPAPHPDKPIEN